MCVVLRSYIIMNTLLVYTSVSQFVHCNQLPYLWLVVKVADATQAVPRLHLVAMVTLARHSQLSLGDSV